MQLQLLHAELLVLFPDGKLVLSMGCKASTVVLKFTIGGATVTYHRLWVTSV